MLICHACLKLAKEPTPPGSSVGKCEVCRCTGNLVDRPDLSLAPVKTSEEPPVDGACVSCGKSCYSMCPACGKYVHPYYGFMNKFCGQTHDAVCKGERK